MKLGTKIFLATVVVAAGGVITYRVIVHKPKLRGPKFLAGDEGVKHVFVEENPVSSKVLDRVHPQVDTDAIADHVVHLSDRTQNTVYDIAHRLWTETDFVEVATARRLSDIQAKAELVRRILVNVAPQTSWHMPREQMSGDRARVWDGVAWLVELMGASAEEQTREEKKAAGAA